MAKESSVTLIRNGDIVNIFEATIPKTNIEVAIKVCALAKTLCPVAPVNGGRLRNSIMWYSNKAQGGFNDSGGPAAPYKISGNVPKNDALVGSKLRYAVYQEFGTRYMKPQPFLRPAIAIYTGQKVMDVLKKICDEELRGKLKPGQKRETFF